MASNARGMPMELSGGQMQFYYKDKSGQPSPTIHGQFLFVRLV